MKIEAVQQRLISKVEVIQNYFWEVIQSFDNIVLKEKEAKAARATFQKVVVLSAKEELSKIPRLSVTEYIRGDIILKVWDANIAERKKMAKEVKDDCKETFDFLDKGTLSIGEDNCLGLLGHINIVRHQLKLKENLNEFQIEIS